jgi:DNA-binding NtrC family response regulator
MAADEQPPCGYRPAGGPDWPGIVREQQHAIEDLAAALEAQQRQIDDLARRVGDLAARLDPAGPPPREGPAG